MKELIHQREPFFQNELGMGDTRENANLTNFYLSKFLYASFEAG